MKNLFHLTKRFGLKKILAVVFVLMLVLTPLHQAHALAWFLPLVGISSGLAIFDYFTKGLGGTVLGAVAWIINLLKGLASLIMTLSGLVFDYALQLSVSFDYDSIKAIETAWSVLRDICNVIFIFMILYIAIDTILGTSSREMVRKLVFIVLIALVINFSLLATKVIIDTSNVAMLSVYNQVATAAGNEKVSLSFTFLNALKLTEDVARANQGQENLEKGNIIVVDIISITLFVVVAWVFLQASFLLIGRVVSFVLLMIFSPLAFIGLVVPYSGFKENTTDWWWKNLTSQAVFGPVFLFLFLVTLRFATDPNFSIKVMNTDHGIDVSGLINFAIVIGMMYTSLTIAKFLGGGMGKSALSWGNWAAGKVAGTATRFAGGAAAGTLGAAGRAFGGSLAYKALQNQKIKTFAASNRTGQMLYGAAGKLASGSWDVRDTTAAKGLGKLGVDLGAAGGAGGYTKRFNDQKKGREEFKKELGEDKVFLNTPEALKARKDYKKLEVEEEEIRNGGKDSTGAPIIGLSVIEKELTKAKINEQKAKETGDENKIKESKTETDKLSEKKYEALERLEKNKKAKAAIDNDQNLKRSVGSIYGEQLEERGKRGYNKWYGLVTQVLTRKANKEAGEEFNKEYQKKKEDSDGKWLKEERKKRKETYDKQITEARQRKERLINEKEKEIANKINTEEGKRGGTYLRPDEEAAIEKKINELKAELHNFRNGSFTEDAKIRNLEKAKKDLGNTDEDLSETIKKAIGETKK